MSTRLRISASLSGLIILAIAPEALAQVGISARTAGMGGVGVAIARGGEGLYYNPAVMPSVDTAEVGLSASAYGYETRTFSNYFQITDDAGGSESADLSIKSISSFPSAASTVVPFELFELKSAVGFGVFIPKQVALESAVLFDPNLYPLAREGQLKEESTEYWITGGAAVDIGPISMGMGLIFQLTELKQLNSLSLFEAGPTILSPTVISQLTSFEAIALDLRAQLGLHVELGPMSLGLSVLTPTGNLGGTSSLRQSSTYSDANFGTALDATVVEGAGSNNAKPLEFTVGGALTLPGFMVSADAAVRLPRKFKPFILEQGNEPFEEPLSLRVALGGSADLSDAIKLRAGFFALPLAETLPTEEEIAMVNERLKSQDPNQLSEAYDQAFALIDATDIRQYGASIGGAYMRGSGRADFALTGVLFTGNHITVADNVTAAGQLESKLLKSGVTGFAVFISVGGTYGFEDGVEKEANP